MTDENTTNATKDTIAPNGHGASNGATHEQPLKADATAPKGAQPSSKKKKRGHRHDKKPESAPVASTASTATDQPTPVESGEQPAAPQPSSDNQAAAPIEEPTTTAQVEELVAAPIEKTVEEAVVVEEPTAVEEPAAALRLRMKVWTDPSTFKRYLMPSAFMRDVVNGQPVTDVMYAYAIGADEVQRVTLTAGEWQALPFSYFQEEAPAPVTPGQTAS